MIEKSLKNWLHEIIEKLFKTLVVLKIKLN